MLYLATELVKVISESSDEQRIAVYQVQQGMKDLSLIIKKNSSSSKNLSALSIDLKGGLEELDDLMSYFKF